MEKRIIIINSFNKTLFQLIRKIESFLDKKVLEELSFLRNKLATLKNTNPEFLIKSTCSYFTTYSDKIMTRDESFFTNPSFISSQIPSEFIDVVNLICKSYCRADQLEKDMIYNDIMGLLEYSIQY